MNAGLDTLPDDVRAILRAERTETEIPNDARRRLAERLGGSVPGFEAPHGPALTRAPLTSVGALSPLATKAILLLVALAAGGAAAVKGVDRTFADGERGKGTTAVTPEAATHAKRDVLEDRDVVPAEAASSVEAPKVTPLARQVPVSLMTTAASLREERRLLDLARDAIGRGEPGEALGPTESHAARFPRGVLAEERDALRIRALARLGRLGEARALLAHLRAAHPQSFLIEGAIDDVRSIP
jgi:hypothetical protein